MRPITEVLRSLPLTTWRRDAVEAWPYHALVPTEVGWSGGVDAEHLDTIANARSVLDPVAEAARVYRDFADTRSPTKAVSEQLGIPYGTARSRIKAAQQRGLLPPPPGQGKRARPDDIEEH